MKTIKIFTNLVYGGWSHKDYETGIGGSEEKLIEFAKYFANLRDDKYQYKYDVTIYMNGEHGDFDNVHYKDHREFKPYEHHDVFISFKNREVLVNTINADKVLYFTTEIEPEWPQYLLDQVDRIITISKYHTSRMGNKGNSKLQHEYLWFDSERANMNIINNKEKGSMLYSASPDRGLEELLANWDKVKKLMNLKTLYITYGWDFIDQIAKNNPGTRLWKERMLKRLGRTSKQVTCRHCNHTHTEITDTRDDIVFLGRINYDKMCEMYWKSEYWCLPLNNPDSELFCINAIKAQSSGAIPVVRRTGALQETVNHFVPWEDVAQHGKFVNLDKKQILDNKKFALDFSLKKRLKEFEKLIS